MSDIGQAVPGTGAVDPHDKRLGFHRPRAQQNLPVSVTDSGPVGDNDNKRRSGANRLEEFREPQVEADESADPAAQKPAVTGAAAGDVIPILLGVGKGVDLVNHHNALARRVQPDETVGCAGAAVPRDESVDNTHAVVPRQPGKEARAVTIRAFRERGGFHGKPRERCFWKNKQVDFRAGGFLGDLRASFAVGRLVLPGRGYLGQADFHDGVSSKSLSSRGPPAAMSRTAAFPRRR